MKTRRISAQTGVLENIWLICLLFFLGSLSLFLNAGFRFPLHDALSGVFQLLAGAGCALWLLRLPGVWKYGAILSGWLQYGMISAGGAMLAFYAATFSQPWSDGALLAFDKALHYSWHDYAQFVARYPAIGTAYEWAYYSLILQPFVICGALPLASRLDRLATYQIATLIALIVTVVMFGALPVTTSWVYGAADLGEAKRLGLITLDHGWVRQLIEIRSGRGRLVDWSIDARIIGFPSFHCAAALLNVWALWNIRALRYAATALNAALIAATPLIGGHYLADLFAGALVASISVIVAPQVYRWFALRSSVKSIRLRGQDSIAPILAPAA